MATHWFVRATFRYRFFPRRGVSFVAFRKSGDGGSNWRLLLAWLKKLGLGVVAKCPNATSSPDTSQQVEKLFINETLTAALVGG